MNTKEFNEIAAAYAAVYSEASVTDDRVRKNQKSFGSNYTPPKDWDQSANRGQGAVLNAKQKEKQRRKSLRKEEVDVFDVIVEHLLSEGYADTAESATAILANMSEEWRDSILEAQEARDNPEKYEQGKEKEEHKKYGKVRGESRPMPPRGNKDREAFEKWYATQRG